MNCLKCPNYWKTDIDETQCNKCGINKTIADVLPVMPPLIMKSEVKNNG